MQRQMCGELQVGESRRFDGRLLYVIGCSQIAGIGSLTSCRGELFTWACRICWEGKNGCRVL